MVRDLLNAKANPGINCLIFAVLDKFLICFHFRNGKR